MKRIAVLILIALLSLTGLAESLESIIPDDSIGEELDKPVETMEPILISEPANAELALMAELDVTSEIEPPLNEIIDMNFINYSDGAKVDVNIGIPYYMIPAVPLKDSAISWNSSNPSVAEISADGIMTAHEKGIATITANYPDNRTVTILVSVGNEAGNTPTPSPTITSKPTATPTPTPTQTPTPTPGILNIRLPKTPVVITEYLLGSTDILRECKITNIECIYAEARDGSITATIYFIGYKTYDHYDNSTYTVPFLCNLYDSAGTLILNDLVRSPAVKVGQTWAGNLCYNTIRGLQKGKEYILKIENY